MDEQGRDSTLQKKWISVKEDEEEEDRIDDDKLVNRCVNLCEMQCLRLTAITYLPTTREYREEPLHR